MNETPAAAPKPADLLPHRDTMLLLDTVVEVDADHAVTETLVKTSWPTATADGASSLLCVELVAQTIGICNIWDLMRAHGENTNKNGWLVAIKKAAFHVATLPIGARLTIRAENGFSFELFREATGWVYWQGEVIAEVVAQIYQDETGVGAGAGFDAGGTVANSGVSKNMP